MLTITASLDGATASKTITVLGNFPPSSALIVESFTLVEYPACVGCAFWAYAPQITLREPTGNARATVVGIKVSSPNLRSVACGAAREYTAGETSPLISIDRSHYNNDLIFVNSTGEKMPDGTATATIYVQDANGALGILTASAGPILRDRTLADLTPVEDSTTWSSCLYSGVAAY